MHRHFLRVFERAVAARSGQRIRDCQRGTAVLEKDPFVTADQLRVGAKTPSSPPMG